MNTVESYQELYRQLAEDLPGHDVSWVRSMRKASLQRFSAMGLPTRKQEEWKYTPLNTRGKNLFLPLSSPSTSIEIDKWRSLPLISLDAYRLVFVDGYLSQYLTDLDALPPGLVVNSLSELFSKDVKNEELHTIFDNGKNTDDWLKALNKTFLTDGAVITVQAGAQFDKPLHLQFINTTPNSTASYICNALVLQANSHVHLLESHVAVGEVNYHNNLQTFIHLDENAQLEHYKLQLDGLATIHLANTEVEQGRDSQYRNYLFALGSSLMRNEIRIALNASGAECFLNGFFLAQNEQHLDIHTRIDHHAAQCTSRETYRGIARDRGKGIFDGLVMVHPDAQHSDARVTTNNLLLSPTAEIDAKPQLEIYADDVKCSHGATIGQLDENVLFYLRSRGIDETVAHNMLLVAFANQSVELCLQPDIKQKVHELLLHYLSGGEKNYRSL